MFQAVAGSAQGGGSGHVEFIAKDSQNAGMNNPFAKAPEPDISLDDMPRRALAIHHMRPDIHEAFDLSSAKGRSDLYWWYFLHGFREMWLDFEPVEDEKGPANHAVPHLSAHGPVPVTWLMRECWRRGAVPGSPPNTPGTKSRWHAILRRFAREPTTRKRQRQLIAWYFCHGMQELNLFGLLIPEQAKQLVAQDGRRHPTPPIVAMAHAMAPDMHVRHSSAASTQWFDWCAGEGVNRFRILALPLVGDRLFPPRSPAQARRGAIVNNHPWGVNVIGHASGRSGVSEDVRMAAEALEAADIPFVVRDAQPSSGVASEETSLTAHLSTRSPFRVNLFCMAGMETVTMFGARPEWLKGHINIGFWPWELAEWPQLWSHAPRMMDELWASTEFTAQAYRRSVDACVRRMPMAVMVDKSDGLTRRDFDLPDDRFLFGFAFDGHSSFSRKNPAACIRAFRCAFPGGDEPVGLLLKGLRVDDSPQWRELEKLAASDPRIRLVASSLSRGALLDLYRSIDAFVSLHRSEGFGRNIAECMLLGKPVIATNYSGNIDFTRPDTAALVDMKLREVRAGEYPFGTGQVWADPCIHHAAHQMRQIFENESWRTRIANAGQMFIKTHHTPAVVGKQFRLRLEAIVKSSSD